MKSMAELIVEALRERGPQSRRQLVALNIGTEYAIASHLCRMTRCKQLKARLGMYSLAQEVEPFLLQEVWRTVVN
jgi:hypothetical protein